MNLNDTLDRVYSAKTENFVELVALSGLDPISDFRFANFEGMDFSNCDLRGFDFTGCDFTKAILGNAKFHGAIIKDALFKGGEKPQSATHKSLEVKRTKIIESISSWLGENLVPINKTCFESNDRSVRAVCTISKKYDSGTPYWFAYHRVWDDFLSEAKRSYFVLGCMDLEKAFAVPRSNIIDILQDLHMSETKNKRYWHVHLKGDEIRGYELVVPKKINLSLDKFELPLK